MTAAVFKRWAENPSLDSIRILDLQLVVSLLDGAIWPPSEPARPVTQPILCTLSLEESISRVASSDDLAHSADYSTVCKALLSIGQSHTFNTVEDLAEVMFRKVQSTAPEIRQVRLKLTKTKAPLHWKSISLECTGSRAASGAALNRVSPIHYYMDGLECPVIIGVNPHERADPQEVRLSVMLERNRLRDGPFDFRTLSRRLFADLQGTSYFTLEALASHLARSTLNCVDADDTDRVTIRVSKPSALVHASAAEVEIRRTQQDFLGRRRAVAMKTASTILNNNNRPSTPRRASVDLDRDPSGSAKSIKSTAATLGHNGLPDSPDTLEGSIQLMRDTSDSIKSTAATLGHHKSVSEASERDPLDRNDSTKATLGHDSAPATPTQASVDLPQPASTDSTETAASYMSASQRPLVRAALALGSNLGDRFANIEHALRLLETPDTLEKEFKGEELAVIDTSFLYESAPMYVTDQPTFINCACLIETTLTPHALLSLAKSVETTVGRIPSVRNGPRAVDLDILTYDVNLIDTRAKAEGVWAAPVGPDEDLTGELIVPHPKMQEREFVLRPLNDMIPDYVHPVANLTVETMLQQLCQSQPQSTPMRRVLPFPKYPVPSAASAKGSPPAPTAVHWMLPDPSTALQLTSKRAPQRTYIMATLNTTPDSFSDGAQNAALPAAIAYTESAVAGGADMIDIGGYSTRPGAAFVSSEEEIERVVPVIEAIRAHKDPRVSNVLISVDTFRPEVARAAVLAGASCVNDVYAFCGPDAYPDTWREDVQAHFADMRKTVRELGVPVVMMHSRGDAGQNKDYAAYRTAEDDGGEVLRGVRAELGVLVEKAVRGRGGVRRWNVIADPGIGFSKTLEGNLSLLRLAELITAPSLSPTRVNFARSPLSGMPVLMGASRKSFLGVILAQEDEEGKGRLGRKTEPHERGWATAGAVASAVQAGAAVVRVHDVQAMADVVRVAEMIRGW